MEFWRIAIYIVWTFVGIVFLITSSIQIYWALSNFNWLKYLNEDKDEE